jgi:predicted amidophosphoribosyltransferase
MPKAKSRGASKFSALSSLIFTTKCPSCWRESFDDLSDFGICQKCSELITTDVIASIRGSVKVFSGSKYSPTLSRLILAAKESNQLQARKFLVNCLSESLSAAVKSLSSNLESESCEIILIPIPSRRAADRARGFAHIELLMKMLIGDSDIANLIALDCLQHAKKIVDQSTLNFHERELNMRGAFKINPRFNNEIARIKRIQSGIDTPQVLETLVFLVDDLVTTGTTVQAANKALNSLGLRVDGTLASCATVGFTY